MTIHHAQLKKAERLGFTLAEDEKFKTIAAFWPKRSVRIHGSSAADAIQQMEAVQSLFDMHPDIKLEVNITAPRLVHATVPGIKTKADYDTPFSLLQWFKDRPADAEDEPEPTKADVERNDAGIALDGAIAYSEGTPAGDCPYDSETEDDEEYANFERWHEEWDAAADEATEAEGEGGSVVSTKYREKYKELGHPTHCGDWLANTLNNLVLGKKTTNLDLFEDICGMNGVDLSPYNRTKNGWQGRLRMTGRNLLAKRVYLAGGILKTPEQEYKAPSDWMEVQRFKMPKAEQSKPIPDAEKSE